MKQIKVIAVLICFAAAVFFTGCNDDPAAPASENTSPTATAGIGRTILVGETAAFTGTASDAETPDGLSFTWSIKSKPSGSAVTDASISGASTLNASFKPDIPGTYTARLTVSDGTAAASAEASIRVVGFAFGLNVPMGAKSGYIHNGVFSDLTPPPSIYDNGYYNTSLQLQNGAVHTSGYFVHDRGSLQAVYTHYQPAFWTGTAVTEVPLPGEENSCFATGMAIGSDGKKHLIIQNESSSYFAYWRESLVSYMDTDIELNNRTQPTYNYSVTGLFNDGGDIFQVGIAATEAPVHYFLARNNTVLIDEAGYDPEPDSSDFDNKGALIVRGNPDTSSKVYLYGQYQKGESGKFAGYTVNNGTWVDLYHSNTYPNEEQYVKFMAATDNYILHIPSESGGYKAVYVNGTAVEMEIPYDGEPDVTISDINYSYMEEIDGSVFVAGGYHYADESESHWNAAAVWRDGILVYEGADPENTDGYKNAGIVAADFE